MSDKKRVLAIFAHSDDELGVCGTLANHAEAGDDVYLAFLTKGENATTVKGSPEEIRIAREEHTRKISELLGVKVLYLDFIDSHIEHNVENGYKIAELIKKVRPHILITWTKYKNVGGGHPDHRNTASLVWDAVSYARYKRNGSKFEPYRERYNFYTYLNLKDNPGAQVTYVDVSDKAEKIQKFIDIYKEAYGEFPVEDFKFGNMSHFGMRAGVKYAEAFEIVYSPKQANKVLS